MIVLKFALALYILVIGGGNRYLHRRHRHRYAPGTAWSYYARLRRQGNWHGTFMLWSTWSFIAIGLGLSAMAAWHLSLSWSPLLH